MCGLSATRGARLSPAPQLPRLPRQLAVMVKGVIPMRLSFGKCLARHTSLEVLAVTIGFVLLEVSGFFVLM